MLAQNFKTPADLEITDAEFDALTKVLGMLERGEITAHQFNMAEWGHCGSVHCIGGWAQTINQSNFKKPNRPKELERLFYPSIVVVEGKPFNGYLATVPQAAIALRNYLTHGEPRWAEAFAE